MFLNDEERAIFFKLYFGLLVWVNKKYKVVKDFSREKHPKSVDKQKAHDIRSKMFQNPNWIDEYLSCSSGNDLTDYEREIVLSWQNHFIMGEFYVMRHLAKYSVFMNTVEEEKVRLYGVIGLNHPFSDFFDRSALPVIINAVILPFQKKIVYDGMFSVYPIRIGPGMRNGLNDSYRASKEKHGIITSLPFDDTVVRSTPKAVARKPSIKPSSHKNEKYDEIEALITKFCNEKLGEEFIAPCLFALGKLSRKRPSPLLGGKANTWACGIVYAIASNNFVFDRSQSYYMTAQDIADGFSLSKSTAQNKSTEINKLLNISYFSLDYIIESMREDREDFINSMRSMDALWRSL